MPEDAFPCACAGRAGGLVVRYQVLEYLGAVALWSWLADLVPLDPRPLPRPPRTLAGRRPGRRHGGRRPPPLVLAADVAGPAAWIGYAAAASAGTAMMIAALAPLGEFRGGRRAVPRGLPLPSLLAPLADRRFLRLLLFGCCCSFAHGLDRLAAEAVFQRGARMDLFVILWLNTGLRLGQMAIGPWMGRLVDCWAIAP